jgi:hypothetical protein
MKMRARIWTYALLGVFAALGQEEPRKPRDFSQTNSVSIRLSDPERRGRLQGNGLEHAFWEADGFTTITNVQGVMCRSLSLTHEDRPKGYFYFALDPTFKRQDISRVKVEVDYFDGFDSQQGVLGVQYDSMRSGDNVNSAYRPHLPTVPLKGSQKWLKATFHLKEASFQNSQNGNCDFRLWASPPELCVKQVTVTRQTSEPAPPPRPLAFTAAGEATLRDWNVQWDSGAKPFFSSQTNGPVRWLELRAPGTNAAGSWRTSVFLPAGEYEFAAKVRTIDLMGVLGCAFRIKAEQTR